MTIRSPFHLHQWQYSRPRIPGWMIAMFRKLGLYPCQDKYGKAWEDIPDATEYNYEPLPLYRNGWVRCVSRSPLTDIDGWTPPQPYMPKEAISVAADLNAGKFYSEVSRMNPEGWMK